MKQGSPWFLYILECGDGTFYTGVTNDLERRVQTHNEGKASRYTRSRRPVKLRHFEPCTNRSDALIREAAVKSLSRMEKERLFKKASDQ
jgi:putative endonuclease